MREVDVMIFSWYHGTMVSPARDGKVPALTLPRTGIWCRHMFVVAARSSTRRLSAYLDGDHRSTQGTRVPSTAAACGCLPALPLIACDDGARRCGLHSLKAPHVHPHPLSDATHCCIGLKKIGAEFHLSRSEPPHGCRRSLQLLHVTSNNVRRRGRGVRGWWRCRLACR